MRELHEMFLDISFLVLAGLHDRPVEEYVDSSREATANRGSDDGGSGWEAEEGTRRRWFAAGLGRSSL